MQTSAVDSEKRGNVELGSTESGGVADEFNVERGRWSVCLAVFMVPVVHFK